MRSNSHFIFDGVDTVELARQYGTPLYVMSARIIRERIEQLKTVFKARYENTEILYASKAFQTLDMIKLVKEAGIGMDVVSGGELYAALKGGMSPEKLYLHGNNKSVEELEMAIDNRIGAIVVDNLHEIGALEKLLEGRRTHMPILLRLSPGLTEIDTHEYITTGQKDTKFGFQIDETLVGEIIPTLLASQHLVLKGFHFHIGSQLFDNQLHVRAFKILFSLIKALDERHGYRPTVLNIGGGFGIPYTSDVEAVDVEALLSETMSIIEASFAEAKMDRPTILIEPGRWVVGPAGITLYQVGAIKTIPHVRTYIAIDGGMTDNIRPALYQARYEADIANRYDQEKTQLVTIAGKACESGDILIKDALVQPVEPGDILAIHATGAYGYTMASNYNRHRIPAVVMTDGGDSRLSVRRQTYEDQLAREITEA